jgi:hypothetical protein
MKLCVREVWKRVNSILFMPGINAREARNGERTIGTLGTIEGG